MAKLLQQAAHSIKRARSLLQLGLPHANTNFICITKKQAPYSFIQASFHSTASNSVAKKTQVPNTKPKSSILSIHNAQASTGKGTAQSNPKRTNIIDVSLEGEARRVKEEVELIIKEIEGSKFFAKLNKKLKGSVSFRHHVKRVLGIQYPHMEMVIYCLGSIEFSYISQYQLAFALLLKRYFSRWIGGIEVFDPRFSPVDVVVLKKFGCKVLPINEKCRRKVEKPTLFFMPHACYNLWANLLQTNWCPSRINQVILLTDSFNDFLDNSKRRRYVGEGSYLLSRQYINVIQKYTKEVSIHAEYGSRGRTPCDFTWHFFDVEPNIDMEKLLPGVPTKTRRSMIGWELDNIFHNFRDLEKYANELLKATFNGTKPNWEGQEWKYTSVSRGLSKYRWFSDPPPAGWVKLNISGKGSDDDSPAGYAGILHDHRKEPLLIYNGSLKKEKDATYASLVALWRGLNLMAQHIPSVKNLIVEGDDLLFIRWVNLYPEPPHRKIKPAIIEIWEILLEQKELVDWEFNYIYKEANLPAIVLANKGSKLDNLQVWMSPQYA